MLFQLAIYCTWCHHPWLEKRNFQGRPSEVVTFSAKFPGLPPGMSWSYSRKKKYASYKSCLKHEHSRKSESEKAGYVLWRLVKMTARGYKTAFQYYISFLWYSHHRARKSKVCHRNGPECHEIATRNIRRWNRHSRRANRVCSKRKHETAGGKGKHDGPARPNMGRSRWYPKCEPGAAWRVGIEWEGWNVQSDAWCMRMVSTNQWRNRSNMFLSRISYH